MKRTKTISPESDSATGSAQMFMWRISYDMAADEIAQARSLLP